MDNNMEDKWEKEEQSSEKKRKNKNKKRNINRKFNTRLEEFFSSGQVDSTYKTNLILQKQIDQDFINKFISDVEKSGKTDLKGSQIKISKGKKILLEIISQRRKLETEICNLKPDDDNFDSKFDDLIKEIDKINQEIHKFSREVKNPLKAVILKRINKRKAIKRRNLMNKALKEQKKRNIEEKHKIIDKLLSERREEVEAAKREAAIKRQADSVLHGVRKRKYEAKKMLNLLTALPKLRELRSAEEEKRGGYCSKQLTETFNKVIERFKTLWEAQLNVYQLEEKGLKIMLQEEALPHEKEAKVKINLLQWEEVLFGDVANNEYEKILTAADSDLQTLIQVRREWDQFLVDNSTVMASSIPPGWVLPLETDNEEWKAFIRTDKKYPL